MYGYFLKRVDQRFQLEKTMKNLPGGSDESKTNNQRTRHFRLYPLTPRLRDASEIRHDKIKRSSWDHRENTEALFGKPEIVITPQVTTDSSKDEQIEISFGGMKRLVLEVVTFGSFLWDVENHVGEGTTLY
ncbi:unnamed protein product [Microthlaspi erraticum]|uniref:Uncharacterized protein n=1 Tax=Microthlaspi erraticum TaxID=1685480 RepID=A0A6D2KAD6_9BRAS|nr:unnamed protein product [Microthlaspi erraticum]